MGCLEPSIFENGQHMTTPPPKVYFWAFRLTVAPRSQYGMDVDQEYCVLCQVRYNNLSQTNRKHLCPINEYVFVWYRMVCRAEAALSWHAKRKFSVCQILALPMTEFPVKSFQWHLLIFLRSSIKQQPHASPASIATTRAILPRTVRISGDRKSVV